MPSTATLAKESALSSAAVLDRSTKAYYGLVGAPSPQGDGAGRRDGRNEGLGGLGARAPGTGGGARAGPSGATQGQENECERGARLSALQKSHSAKNIRFPMPACRRTPRS